MVTIIFAFYISKGRAILLIFYQNMTAVPEAFPETRTKTRFQGFSTSKKAPSPDDLLSVSDPFFDNYIL